MSKKKHLLLIILLILAGFVLAFIGTAVNENPETVTNPEMLEQERIKSLIESLNGVSDVSVLLTFSTEEEVNAGSFSNKETNRVQSKVIKGIAVSANGGDDYLISEKIKSLLCAAYDIPESAVFVCGK